MLLGNSNPIKSIFLCGWYSMTAPCGVLLFCFNHVKGPDRENYYRQDSFDTDLKPSNVLPHGNFCRLDLSDPVIASLRYVPN